MINIYTTDDNKIQYFVKSLNVNFYLDDKYNILFKFDSDTIIGIKKKVM